MVLFALLAACTDTDPAADGDFAGARLEAFGATDPRSVDGEESSASGPAAVTGEQRDWTLTVTLEDDTDVAIAIHVPGRSDLSALDGRTLAVELGNSWNDDRRNVEIADEDGAAFYAQHTQGGPATTAFGDDFVAYGDELGTGELEDEYGTYAVTYHTARFQTDDGEIDAYPGEPFEADIGGQRWRVVSHAAFEVTDYQDTMPGCGGGLESSLSFEMLRISDDPDLEPVSAAQDRPLAGEGSCGGE